MAPTRVGNIAMNGPRRPREIIERLPGGFLIDVEGQRSIETAEMVAGLIQRIWPEVASYMAAAAEATEDDWRGPTEIEQ